MPGIFGFNITEYNNQSIINKMSDAMLLHDQFIQDEFFMDTNIASSKIHLGLFSQKLSSLRNTNVIVWIDGESYNLSEVSRDFGFQNDAKLEDLIKSAYEKGSLEKLLSKLEGNFSAVIYDQNKDQIKLISDRYGLRMLYWYFNNGQFAWASEVKGILALNNLDISLNFSSLNCFKDLGYLLCENTFFNEIKLIKPATILTFEIKNKTIYQSHYWSWSKIKKSNLKFEEAVDELGQRFIKSVERRFKANEKIGISLSGGLDSRAILAAVQYLYPNYLGSLYTFGNSGSDDVEISKIVASITNWEHIIYNFADDWFEERIKRIWDTDGMLDIQHMHGLEHLDFVSKKMDINLNGYAGDLVLGGSFFDSIPLNERANQRNLKSFFKHHINLVDIDSEFYDINCVEPVLYMNRVRRLTGMGLVSGLSFIEQRCPFYDNDLVELCFSLPDEYRKDNKLYSAMLSKYFPIFFKDIPWQKTGLPVSATHSGIFRRGIKKGYKIMKKLIFNKTNDFIDYKKAMNDPAFQKRIKQTFLDSPNAQSNPANDWLISEYSKLELGRINSKSLNVLFRLITMKTYFAHLDSRNSVLWKDPSMQID